jgi:hypothetical protein
MVGKQYTGLITQELLLGKLYWENTTNTSHHTITLTLHHHYHTNTYTEKLDRSYLPVALLDPVEQATLTSLQAMLVYRF